MVVGVLAAGATFKMADEFGMQLSQVTKWAVEWGHFALTVPLAWITTAMIVQGMNDEQEYPEALTFLSGVVVLFLLILGGLTAAVAPWVRMCSFGLSA